MKSDKKYVVLEHLLLPYRGKRFWSTNSENNTHGYNGELWYKEVLFTDSADEAIAETRKENTESVPTTHELVEHFAENPGDLVEYELNLLSEIAVKLLEREGK